MTKSKEEVKEHDMRSVEVLAVEIRTKQVEWTFLLTYTRKNWKKMKELIGDAGDARIIIGGDVNARTG